MFYRQNEVYHYGIPNMKWGRRRYQYNDGTRTALGRLRERSDSGGTSLVPYNGSTNKTSGKRSSGGESSDGGNKSWSSGSKTTAKKSGSRDNEADDVKKNDKAKSNKKDNNKEKTPAEQIVSAGNSIVDASRKISAKKSTKKVDLSNMSDQQLRDMINRAELEKRYSDILVPETASSKGMRYTKTILETAGGIICTAGSAVALAAAIKELNKGKSQ